MTNRHVYFAVENLALDDTQRGTLIDALKELGPSSDSQPARLCHWRTRLDGDAVIFEALFNEDNVTVQAFKTRLGEIFSVDPTSIDHSTSLSTFDTLQTAIVTFSRGGTDYLRVAIFGYDGATWPTWEQSRIETLAYLAANRADWEPA